jgi:hypothetical protein
MDNPKEEENQRQKNHSTETHPQQQEPNTQSTSDISEANSTYQNTVILSVKSQGTMSDVVFRIKRDRPFAKLFSHYYKQSGLQPGSVRFIFDGTRIDESQTPQDLDMEDHSIIDAAVQQIGGR